MQSDEIDQDINAGFRANQEPPYATGHSMPFGPGSRDEHREAMAEYRRAAEKGDRNAQEILGFLSVFGPQVYGRAVERDLAAAHRWLWLAAAQGSLVARHLLRSIDPGSAIGEGGSTVN